MNIMSQVRKFLNFNNHTFNPYKELEKQLQKVRENSKKIKDAGKLAFSQGYTLSDNPFLGDTELSRLWATGFCKEQNKKVLQEKFGLDSL